MRSAQEVFDSHLELRQVGKIEKDIDENYSPRVVIISHLGFFQGHDGVRQSAKILSIQVPSRKFNYEVRAAMAEMAYLVWSTQLGSRIVRGTDTFLIREGKIITQTIFYEIT